MVFAYFLCAIQCHLTKHFEDQLPKQQLLPASVFITDATSFVTYEYSVHNSPPACQGISSCDPLFVRFNS